MKKITLLLLCLLTLPCVAQKVDSEYFTYSDNAEYKVKRFNSSKTSLTGGDVAGTTHIARKNTSFRSAWLEFKNSSEEDIMIDFEDFYIVDKQNNKYQAKFVVQGMKMTTTNENLQLKLKGGKTKTFIVEFWPPFPKDELPALLVKDKLIDLEKK